MLKFPKYLLIIAFIFGLIVFWPSFSLALFGDDWNAIYYFNQAVKQGGLHSAITHFFTPYGPQDTIMGVLTKIFGYQSGTPFYIISFLLRLFAGSTLIPIVNRFTKSKSPAFFALLTFITIFAGIDATNWTFNMTAYAGIGFLNLSIYYFLISKEGEYKKNYLLLWLLFFFLAVISVPTRIVGFAVIFPLMDIFWLTKEKKGYTKKLLLEQIILIIILVLISFACLYGSHIKGQLEEARLNIFVLSFYKNFLYHLFADIGSIILPERISQIIFSLQASGSYVKISFVAGLIGVILQFILIVKHRKDKFSDLYLIALIYSLCGILIPQLIWPDLIFTSYHRYLIMSVPGITLFGSALIAENKKMSKFIISIITILIIINSFLVKNFLKDQKNARDNDQANKIWEVLLMDIHKIDKVPRPVVFYFEGDGTNSDVIYNILVFGFQARMAIIFDNYTDRQRNPIQVDNFKELTEMVTTGKPLTSNNFKEKPLPINQIYAFKLTGRSDLTDITDSIRVKFNNQLQ